MDDHVKITADVIYDHFYRIINGAEGQAKVREISRFVAMKNDYYRDAWQRTGLLTSLTDIIDKQCRVGVLRDKEGNVVGQYMMFPEENKGYDLRDILRDLGIRAWMAWLKFDKIILSEPLSTDIIIDREEIFVSDDPFDRKH